MLILWFRVDQAEVIAKTWQWVCHIETARRWVLCDGDIAEIPLQCATATVHCAFYNVANTVRINCYGRGRPRASCALSCQVYGLDGQLVRAPHTETLVDFNVQDVCLDDVQVKNSVALSLLI